MGFQNIGVPTMEHTKQNIETYLKIYFRQWINTYNFKDYTNHIYNAEINKREVDANLLLTNQESYALEQKKTINGFVTLELITISETLLWIEKAFKSNSETNRHPDFFRFKKQFETKDNYNEHSTQDFLLNLKNKKPLSESQFDSYLFKKISNLTDNEILYFLTLMYLDFIKIKEFLKSKFEPIPKRKENKSETKETSLNDFFNNLKIEEIENLKSTFQECRGIEMACFIHQLVKDEYLFLIKNSNKKSLKRFCFTFSNMNKNDYEAIRKLFKYDSYNLENENYLIDYKTDSKINDALKVG